MFSLAKLSYYACNNLEKKWYYTVPKSVFDIDMQECCELLLRWRSKNERPSGDILTSFKLCTIAAKHGHLDCVIYAHNLGFKWEIETCNNAAINGHLDVLVYAHEHGCPWDGNTCAFAAKHGHVDILKYAHEQGCPWAENTYELAAKNGHLNIINYAYDHGFPLNVNIRDLAASNGHIAVLKFAKEHGYPWDESTCALAASNGHLDTLKYAHEHGCPWDVNTCILAASNGHLDILKYAHEHRCPWDLIICKLAIQNEHYDVLKYVHKCGLRFVTVFKKGWRHIPIDHDRESEAAQLEDSRSLARPIRWSEEGIDPLYYNGITNKQIQEYAARFGMLFPKVAIISHPDFNFDRRIREEVARREDIMPFPEAVSLSERAIELDWFDKILRENAALEGIILPEGEIEPGFFDKFYSDRRIREEAARREDAMPLPEAVSLSEGEIKPGMSLDTFREHYKSIRHMYYLNMDD